MPQQPIRELLKSLTNASAAELARHSYRGLPQAEIDKLSKRDVQTYTGKVRDVVRIPNGELLIVHSDRLTAFDKLISHVPYKGTILTAISEYWLEEAKKVVPTHLIARPHERVLRTRLAEPVKAEVIVRGYLAGSMQRAYEKGERTFCGAKLPNGLKAHQALPEAIITPTTKAAAFEHDEDTTPAEIVAKGVATKAEWDKISKMALDLFAHGQKVSKEKGWILVDTKYEFGRTKSGELIVIDEIHTPDSSRFWIEKSYESRFAAGEAPDMMDKEVVRRWLMANGFKGEGKVPEVPAAQLVALAEVYLTVAETLTGKPLTTAGPAQTIDLTTML